MHSLQAKSFGYFTSFSRFFLFFVLSSSVFVSCCVVVFSLLIIELLFHFAFFCCADFEKWVESTGLCLIELMSYGLASAKPLSEVTMNLTEKFCERFPHFPLVAQQQLACNSEKNKLNIDKTIEGSREQQLLKQGAGRRGQVVGGCWMPIQTTIDNDRPHTDCTAPT